MKENETKMKTKSPDITSRLLKFLNVSAVCVFYVVMICIFENQFFFLGAKLIIKLIQIKKKAVFYAKKNVNVCKFCPPQQGSFCNKKSKNIRFYFVFSAFYSIFAPNYI